MKNPEDKPAVLVLGGRGYIGQHIVKHLDALGANVIVGTRGSGGGRKRSIKLHKINGGENWIKAIRGVNIVINAVGILRERPKESYERIHHAAVAALADACHTTGARLIHISALGLNSNAHSRFLKSKRDGETALKRSKADWFIVRPSLVDGEGGFGARWFRRAANWPVHLMPASATGKLAPININDLGEAVARLALNNNKPDSNIEREYDLGGEEHFVLSEYLDALAAKPALMKVTIPAVLARMVAHICDLLHVTPYSYGHHELLKHNNLPQLNRLSELLCRPATRIGYRAPKANRAQVQYPQLPINRSPL